MYTCTYMHVNHIKQNPDEINLTTVITQPFDFCGPWSHGSRTLPRVGAG